MADGTVAQPIVFTSLNDDAHGGKISGSSSSPLAGDWGQIFNYQGTASFDHVEVLYGSGNGSTGNNSGAVRNQGGTMTFSDSTISQSLYDGFDAYGGGSTTITNCLVTYSNRAVVSTVAPLTITNSTLDNNTIGLFLHVGGSITATNCIITNSALSGVSSDGGPIQITYSDVWNTGAGAVNYSGTTNPTGTNGDISVDPNYVDPADGNYRLNFRSPGIDSGNALVAPATDMMGDPLYNDPRTNPKTGIPIVSTFSSGLDEPEGLAFDASGNLYVANEGNNTISEVTLAGVVSIFVSSGLSGPEGLAFDASGNLYVANEGNNTISKVTPTGVVSTFVSSGLDAPFGLAFDANGNLYVANEGNNTISTVTPTGVVSTFVSSGLNEPTGLAFDTGGNLYVANEGNNTISKVTSAGAISTFVSSGLNEPTGLAFDAGGNLYVANEGNNAISTVTPAGAVWTFVSSGLDAPAGLAFGAGGKPYIANSGSSSISTAEYADMGAYNFVESATSNLDLTVTSVTGPATATASQQATIQWTDANVGTGTIIGPWHDSVYLVRNPGPNQTEILAGTVLVGQGVTLGPGQSYTASATINVPGDAAGTHYWAIECNSEGDIFVGQNTANTTLVSPSPMQLSVPALSIGGGPVSGQFSAVGAPQWYEFTPQAGQDILVSVNMTDTAGAAKLYISQGYMPSPLDYDDTASQWNSPNVTALAANTSALPYYVLVEASSLSARAARSPSRPQRSISN